MKKAVIVVGKRHAGKSTTIRNFKQLVNMEGFHVFTLKGKRGYILSMSFEEAPDRDVKTTVKNLSGYDFLVFACRDLLLKDLHRALKKASFVVRDVDVQTFKEAPKKAKEILKVFESNVTK